MTDTSGVSRRGLLKVGAAAGVVGAVGLGGATAAEAKPLPAGRTREYWIQADSFRHNLVPTGMDNMMGMMFKPSDSTFWAIGFRAYTPGWKHLEPANADIGPNRGIPGPIIRAAVGDTVVVHFRNNDTHYRVPHSMHTHGFSYDQASTGSYRAVDPPLPGSAVPVGGTYTYTWTAKANSVGTWLYHDHSMMFSIPGGEPEMELGAELGLFGMIAITDAHTPRVDREFFLFFHDLYQENVPSLSQDYDAFNGLSYLGNTDVYVAELGDKVRWRIATLGKEFHVFHLHGHRWISQATGRPVDSEILGPSTTLTVEYTEDNKGDWLYHCHVVDHMEGGMFGSYQVGR
jgi:FtsP/CotA-like multicopper oxidase with cupredoxin domain